MFISIISSINFLFIISLLIFIIYYVIRYPSSKNLYSFIILGLCICFITVFSTVYFALWYFLNLVQGLITLYLIYYSIASIFNWKIKKDVSSGSIPADYVIAVIVAVHNEENVIEASIQNLLNMNCGKNIVKVYVIDDDSSDKSLMKAQKFNDSIIIIERKKAKLKGKPAAINELIPEIDADLICIFDADSLPEKDFILKATRYFDDVNIGIVQARNLQYNENKSIISKINSIDIDCLHFSIYHPKSLLDGMPLFEGRGGIFRKSVFLKLNGFDQSLPTEDWDFSYRAQLEGFRVIYDPDIVNREQTVETVREYGHQRYRWLSSTVFTLLKNFPRVLNSKLTNAKKLDFLFNAVFLLWGISFNLLGFMLFLNFYQNNNIYEPLYIYLFLSILLIFIAPAFKKRKNISDVLYLPLMYIYYWSFTLILSYIVVERFILHKKPKYVKAQHSKFVEV